jgi:hypothetical protein
MICLKRRYFLTLDLTFWCMQVVKDKIGASKGFGYVDFVGPESVIFFSHFYFCWTLALLIL